MTELKKSLLLLAVLVFAGCEGEQLLTTPEMKISCPVCGQEAELRDFSEYEARYECPGHRIELRRKTGEVNSASIIRQPLE